MPTDLSVSATISTNLFSIFLDSLKSTLNETTKAKILKISSSSFAAEGGKTHLVKRRFIYTPLNAEVPCDNRGMYEIALKEAQEIAGEDRDTLTVQFFLKLLEKPYESQEVQNFLNEMREYHLENQRNPFSLLQDKISEGLANVSREQPPAGIHAISVKVLFFKKVNPDEILSIKYKGKPPQEDI